MDTKNKKHTKARLDQIRHNLLARQCPIASTNDAVTPNLLHQLSPLGYPKMLTNIGQEEICTDMLKALVECAYYLFREWVATRQERRVKLIVG